MYLQSFLIFQDLTLPFLAMRENYIFPLRMQGIFMKSASRLGSFAAVASSWLAGLQKSPVPCFFGQLGQPVSFPRAG